MAKACSFKRDGDAQYHAKQYSQALKLYDSALDCDPHNAILLNNRARIHFKLKDWDNVKRDSSAAIKITPR